MYVLKPLIWLLSLMLIIGFVALFVLAAHDEGMIKKNLLVKICSVICNFFYFPLWYIEGKIMPSSNVFFVVMYFINITLWAILFAFLFRLFKRFIL